MLAAWAQPDRNALTILAKAVARMRWTSRTLTAVLHQNTLHYAASFTGSVPILCTDMQTWVHSGYTRLGLGTEELVHRREAHQKLLRRTPNDLVNRLLARYEDASDKALTRHLNALAETLNRATGPLASAKQRIEQVTDMPNDLL